PAVAGLVRAVADHWCGSFADVVRLAVPPRHATTERAEPRVRRVPDAGTLDERLRTAGPGPFTDAAGGAGFLTALRTGNAPRAAWQPVPAAGPGWADGFALAAAATLAAGKGTLCVAPDVTDLAHLETACTALVGH